MAAYTTEQLLALPPDAAGQLVADSVANIDLAVGPMPIYEFDDEARAGISSVCEKLNADADATMREGRLIWKEPHPEAETLPKEWTVPPGEERMNLIREFLSILETSMVNRTDVEAADQDREDAIKAAFERYRNGLSGFLTSCAQRASIEEAEASVRAFQDAGGMVELLLRAAAENKTDPIIGPFLAKLRVRSREREEEEEEEA